MTIQQRAAKLARVLGNPVRLQILTALQGSALCVTGLVERIGRPQANVSQHLMVLRAAGLVVSEREGMRIRYRLRNQHVAELVNQLTEIAFSLEELDTDEVMQRKSCRKRLCGTRSPGKL